MGWECYVVTHNETYNYIKELSAFERIDPKDFVNSRARCDLLVIDHRELGDVYERSCEAFAKRILIIDDSSNRPHFCHILVDQTFGRDKSDYIGWVPPECTVLAGSQYAMIRPDFVKLRSEALKLRDQSDFSQPRILLSLGGGDSTELIKVLLDKLTISNLHIQIDVVVGFANSKIEDAFRDNEHIKFYMNPDMSQLTLKADLAIGAAGSSMWERCCLGLPTIMITVGEDQFDVAQNLHEYGAGLYAGHAEGVDPRGLLESVNRLLNDKKVYRQMQEKAFQVCDGKGAQRVVEVINASY
jgi:UDP-2,4-diacetamido-2,4,6-trideoxy-beta-L-altropyranose hydrolase